MNLQEYQINIIEMLAKNEKVISQLYKIYAKKFLDYKNFWSRLAEEEIEHAGWIYKLHSKIKEGSLYFNEGRFKKEALQSFLNYARNELVRTEIQEMLLINALSLALDIENTLIEHKYFEVFEGDSVELKQVLLNLDRATNEHLDRIKKVLSELKGKA